MSAEAVISELFAQAECVGFLSAQRIDGGGESEFSIKSDAAVVLASTVKLPIALEFADQTANGEIDATTRLRIPADRRTPGPTGLSSLVDDVEMSLRDLATLMMSVSDNTANDVVLDTLGIDAVNERIQHLGLTATAVTSGIREIVDRIAVDMGFPTWNALVEAQAGRLGEQARERALDRARLGASRELDPAVTSCSTAYELARLVNLVWTNAAASEEACAEVRRLMGTQFDRNRIMGAFPEGVQVSASSGSLIGIVRHEVAAVEYPEGDSYAVAVCTTAFEPFRRQEDINRTIGQAARTAVEALRAEQFVS